MCGSCEVCICTGHLKYSVPQCHCWIYRVIIVDWSHDFVLFSESKTLSTSFQMTDPRTNYLYDLVLFSKSNAIVNRSELLLKSEWLVESKVIDCIMFNLKLTKQLMCYASVYLGEINQWLNIHTEFCCSQWCFIMHEMSACSLFLLIFKMISSFDYRLSKCHSNCISYSQIFIFQKYKN